MSDETKEEPMTVGDLVALLMQHDQSAPVVLYEFNDVWGDRYHEPFVERERLVMDQSKYDHIENELREQNPVELMLGEGASYVVIRPW